MDEVELNISEYDQHLLDQAIDMADQEFGFFDNEEAQFLKELGADDC